MNKKILFALLLVTFIFLLNTCKKDDDEESSEREQVISDYKTNYLGSDLSNSGWTGSVTNCNAGTIPSGTLEKIRQRINYFRKLVGLPTSVTFNSEYNAKCQKAALMFKANNALNHYPPSSWICFTQDGYEAAGSSNIAKGTGTGAQHSVKAITGFINDYGSGNESVGHRRWLLFSKAKVMGAGSTDNTQATWILGNASNPIPSGMPSFIAYPPKGYIPAPLVFSRWSFGIPDADFSNSTVTMTDASNNPVSLTVVSKTEHGCGDNSIVWEPQGINTSSSSDITYKVTVSNANVGGNTKSYSYNVVIIQPD